MTDTMTLLRSIKRPALLMQAARLAQRDYARAPNLRRILPGAQPKGPRETVLCLMEAERPMEEARREGSAAYSPARHVTVLAALVNEAGRLADATRASQVKASDTSPLRRAI